MTQGEREGERERERGRERGRKRGRGRDREGKVRVPRKGNWKNTEKRKDRNERKRGTESGKTVT